MLDAVKRNLIVPIGVVILLIGALWTLQGLGYVGGSGMSGKTIWAIIGPIVGLVGLGLAVVGARNNRQAG
jgi:hypothetical protein